MLGGRFLKSLKRIIDAKKQNGSQRQGKIGLKRPSMAHQKNYPFHAKSAQPIISAEVKNNC